jgi:UDP:flavonoid glycosyltransferase YjiC (YdhE family)
MALANGVPVVASGISEDKAEVGNRVQVAGAGINLKSASPPVAKIRDAVRAVLQDPRYRANAKRLQQESVEYDAPRLARDLLEELARTRQPVLHDTPRRTSPVN